MIRSLLVLATLTFGGLLNASASGSAATIADATVTIADATVADVTVADVTVADVTVAGVTVTDAAKPSAAAEALALRLHALDRYLASFTQEIIGAQGQVMEQSTGSIRLLRPDFKWVVDDPYPQIIVTEDNTLKVYDPDLEQLTVRPLAEALLDTPVSLLTREDVILGEDYEVAQFLDDGGESYRIVPLAQESLFAEIRLHFSVDTLIGLDIVDHLGQYTTIRFAPGADTSVIQSGDFHLIVPPGTDVIGG